jgi:hypothetical protein
MMSYFESMIIQMSKSIPGVTLLLIHFGLTMYLIEFHRHPCDGFTITWGWRLGSALAEDRNSPFIIVLLVISLFLINDGLRRLGNSREKLHVYVKNVLE